MEKIEVVNILPMIQEVKEKYMPLMLNTKDREITEKESQQLFELSTKLDLLKLVKTMFMEEFTKNDKLIDFLLKSEDPEHKLTTHIEQAEKDGKKVDVEVFDQSMDERIAMMPKQFAEEIFGKMAKAHKENLIAYKNNPQLLKKEQFELDIINTFLPKEATKEDVIAWLNENYPNGITQKEMGPTIGKAKGAFARADGKMVSECVRSIIQR